MGRILPGDLTELYDQAGGVRERVWKLLAYLGRYAHQSMGELRAQTVRELGLLASEVSTLVQEENTPASGADR